jgi:hypothetical protein
MKLDSSLPSGIKPKITILRKPGTHEPRLCGSGYRGVEYTRGKGSAG